MTIHRNVYFFGPAKVYVDLLLHVSLTMILFWKKKKIMFLILVYIFRKSIKRLSIFPNKYYYKIHTYKYIPSIRPCPISILASVRESTTQSTKSLNILIHQLKTYTIPRRRCSVLLAVWVCTLWRLLPNYGLRGGCWCSGGDTLTDHVSCCLEAVSGTWVPLNMTQEIQYSSHENDMHMGIISTGVKV